jgi:UDP-GlcNAc:undecaprenyl-phosphate GlcNAc-1-phosphate transferase
MALKPDIIYGFIFGAAFCTAAALTPLARVFGRRFGFIDEVNPAKIHNRPHVRCGGIAIFGAFMLILGGGLLLASCPAVVRMLPAVIGAYLKNIPLVAVRLIAIFAGAALLFVVGLIDDRRPIRPVTKLIFQILSTLPLVFAGITIRFFIPGEIVGAILTIGWVVFITNAFNLLDNMNGLSSGVALMAALNFYLISRAGGEVFMMAMFALLAGSILGFIPFNFPKASIFMGDCGSMFIGYLLAALSIMVTYYDAGVPTALPVVSPLIVLGVPIFDTLSVMHIRWKNGKPLMQGDQNHFSHRMVALGFSRVQAVLFIWFTTFTVGLSAVNLRWLGLVGAVVSLVQVFLFFTIIYLLESVAKKRLLKK